MKAKVKLDLGAIKKFLLEQGEKLAFGLIFIVFAMFTYSAMKREVLDASKQPEKLVSAAQEAKSHVENSAWNQEREGVQLTDYQDRAKRQPVVLNLFALKTPWSSPLADARSKRDDPQLLPLEELRVVAGNGTFALRSDSDGGRNVSAAPSGGQAGQVYRPSATAKLKAQPWAAITGLVPIEKQRAEYARVFDLAQGGNPERDKPMYRKGAKLMRAEIDPNKPVDVSKLDWKPVPMASVFEAQWEGEAGELVAPAYVDRGLTGRLGPLVSDNWDESVSHPKIPLASAQDNDAANKAANQPAALPAAAPNAPVDDFASADPSKLPGATTDPNQANSNQATIEYKLFRAFDYTAEANKTYRYKVTVAIDNPNYNLDRKLLLRPDKEQKPYLLIESGPTDAVTVPGGFGVLAGGVTPTKGDPSATLILTSIDRESGLEAVTEVLLQRGSMANSSEKTAKARDPRNEQIVELTDVDLKTGMVVLDMIGGKALSTRRGTTLISPAEVLLLDPTGRLVVRSEIDDQSLYAAKLPPEDEDGRAAEPIPTDSKKRGSSGSTRMGEDSKKKSSGLRSGTSAGRSSR